MKIVIDSDRLEAILRAAYIDGCEDGFQAREHDDVPPDHGAEPWADSVTKDQFDALCQRVRNGGQP